MMENTRLFVQLYTKMTALGKLSFTGLLLYDVSLGMYDVSLGIYLSREDSHLFQVVSNSKFVSVGVKSPTEINAPRGCAVIL